MIRVEIPEHLRTLARVSGEVQLEVAAPVTQASVLDALEARYPMLRGTIRDQASGKRRAFVRFFACEEDLSHEPPDAPLPPRPTVAPLPPMPRIRLPPLPCPAFEELAPCPCWPEPSFEAEQAALPSAPHATKPTTGSKSRPRMRRT